MLLALNYSPAPLGVSGRSTLSPPMEKVITSSFSNTTISQVGEVNFSFILLSSFHYNVIDGRSMLPSSFVSKPLSVVASGVVVSDVVGASVVVCDSVVVSATVTDVVSLTVVSAVVCTAVVVSTVVSDAVVSASVVDVASVVSGDVVSDTGVVSVVILLFPSAPRQATARSMSDTERIKRIILLTVH